MTRVFWLMLRRDLLLAWRRLGEVLTPLMFFVMVTVIFPLGLAPEPELLGEIAPGVIWAAALLAALLGLDALFRADYEDGSLEQLALSGQPLTLLVAAKITAHWLSTGLPLVLLAPLLAAMLSLPAAAWPALMLGLLLGTPVFSLLGAIGAALTVALRGQGMLLPVLILPLAVPALIFGARGVAVAALGRDPAGAFYLLGALLVLGLVLAPLAAAKAVRINLE